MKQIKIKYFTMVETVIALGVMVIALSAIFSTIAVARQRVIKAENRWKKQHMLTQATEYYLLAPPGIDIPQTVFPFDGYQVFCEYNAPERLPPTVETTSGNWQLVSMKVVLNEHVTGKTVDSITVDRIVKLDDH